MKQIIKIVSDRLKTAGGTLINDAVTGRIYLDESPADVACPMIVWTIGKLKREKSFNSISYTGTIEFLIMTDRISADNAYGYADKLKVTIDNWSGSNATDTSRVFLTKTDAGVPLFDEDIWTITETYSLLAFLSSD
jgi:hypothetical protein